MSKIIVVGANQTGILCAELLGKQSHEVHVYEKCEKDVVAYPWHDDMTPSAFARIGIDMPPSDMYHPNRDIVFISPDKKTKLAIDFPNEGRDISIWRRPLNDWLYDRAKDYATFHYGVEVSGAIIKDNWVKGVTLDNGEKVEADLVVDCSGVNSVIRRNLPDEWGIPHEVNPANVFVIKRYFFKRNDIEGVNTRMNLYLKHLGENGISWCIDHPENDTIDVLVGRTVGLTDENFDRALEDIKQDFPAISDQVAFGGDKAIIPVQRAISLMVAGGYCLLGDSAFMTIPMIGSGMATSMIGARILSDVLSENLDFSKENLYKYQVAFMKEVGASNSGIDILKNWLLSIPAKDIDFLFGKKIISEKELASVGDASGIKLGLKDILTKVANGITRIPLLLSLVGALNRMEKQIKIANEIPEKWDAQSFAKWQSRYDKM